MSIYVGKGEDGYIFKQLSNDHAMLPWILFAATTWLSRWFSLRQQYRGTIDAVMSNKHYSLCGPLSSLHQLPLSDVKLKTPLLCDWNRTSN